MRVLVAFDKFKDSLSAREACESTARALRAIQPGWQADLCPLADGGEGFVEILTQAARGELVRFCVDGPRGGPVEAAVGLVMADRIPAGARTRLGLGEGAAHRKIALIEMAAASGLALLPLDGRDPWQASSYGTGQLVRAAAELGAALILLGVGGSATNDLGLGALGALGFDFRDRDANRLRPAIPALWPRLAKVEGALFESIPPIRIACDVSNPLLGPRGAAAVFGPQKGLRQVDHARMEAESWRVAKLLLAHVGRPRSLTEVPGAGAAGGIAFGLMAAANAQLLPGADLVGAWLDLEARLAAADLVITGEGRYDGSSLEGKGPGAVAARAAALGKPVHVFAGQVAAPESPCGPRLHAITPPGMVLPEALRTAGDNLVAAVRREFSAPGPSAG